MDILAEKTYVLKRHEKQFRLCHYNFDIEKERHIFLGYNQFKTEDDANIEGTLCCEYASW